MSCEVQYNFQSTLNFQEKGTESDYGDVGTSHLVRLWLPRSLAFPSVLSEDRKVHIYLFNSCYYACPPFHFGWRLFNKLVCVIFSCEGQGLSPHFPNGVCIVPSALSCLLPLCLGLCVYWKQSGIRGDSKTLAHLLWFKFVPLDCQNYPF